MVPAKQEVTGTRRRLPPTKRREQLLVAGAAVFAERGFDGTSLADIADRAGVTRPLMYRYFTDKAEIYREILRTARKELDEALIREVAAVEGPRERLRAGISAYFAFVQDRGQEWDLLFGGGTPVTGDIAKEWAELRFSTADMIAGLVVQAIPTLDAVAASAYAHTLSGATEQLAKWWRRHPAVGVEEVTGYALDVIWGGLQTVYVERSLTQG